MLQAATHHSSLSFEAILQPAFGFPALDVDEEDDHQAADVVDEPEATPAEPAALTFNSIFARYNAMKAVISEAISQQQALERSLFGSSFTQEPSFDGDRSIARSALSALQARAEREFAPRGATSLCIRMHEFLEAVGMADWEEQFRYRSRSQRENDDDVPDNAAVESVPLDLDKLWKQLEAAYGGDAG